MNHNFKDITGQQFGKIVVINYVDSNKNGQATWNCICYCGNLFIVEGHSLRRGNTTSCGCSRIQHGSTRSVEYKAYLGAKARCKTNSSYVKRGIKFQFTSFKEWFSELGIRPSPIHSVNRIDNNGDYIIGNIEWTLPIIQNNNTSRNVLLSVNGEEFTLAQWSKKSGLNRSTIKFRYRSGWCAKCIVTLSVNQRCAHRIK